MPFVSPFLFQLGISDSFSWVFLIARGICARSHLLRQPWAEFLECKTEWIQQFFFQWMVKSRRILRTFYKVLPLLWYINSKTFGGRQCFWALTDSLGVQFHQEWTAEGLLEELLLQGPTAWLLEALHCSVSALLRFCSLSRAACSAVPTYRSRLEAFETPAVTVKLRL